LNLDRIAEKALESNTDLVITVFATRILLFGAFCKVPRAKLDEIIPTSESASGRSMNLRSSDKEIFWISFAADKIATKK
jgi:hypothetical protein